MLHVCFCSVLTSCNVSNSSRLKFIDTASKFGHGRFQTAEEFVLALERGEAGLLPAPRKMPYPERDPVRFWRAIALSSLVVNLLLLYWFLAR